jgi:nucleoside 2-deoxyribosyltransferase
MEVASGDSKIHQPAQSAIYTFYFGGELFSGKHLLGNAVLAESIFQRSNGKYQAVLPQNLEQRDTTPHAIRDSDIQALLACDLGLFHYDGPELDSGTVVEFMFAKFADMPAVLVRSDFRGGGDQAGAGDPWNLMSSFFPRTASVVVDAMALYKQGLEVLLPEAASMRDALQENRSGRAGQAMIDATADAVIAAFDKVITMPGIMPTAMQDTVYQWLAMMPGFKEGGVSQIERMEELCAAKKAKGLL